MGTSTGPSARGVLAWAVSCAACSLPRVRRGGARSPITLTEVADEHLVHRAAAARAWDRMVADACSGPFALQNWIVVGFAAFLSEYLSHALGGRYSWRDETRRDDAAGGASNRGFLPAPDVGTDDHRDRGVRPCCSSFLVAHEPRPLRLSRQRGPRTAAPSWSRGSGSVHAGTLAVRAHVCSRTSCSSARP